MSTQLFVGVHVSNSIIYRKCGDTDELNIDQPFLHPKDVRKDGSVPDDFLFDHNELPSRIGATLPPYNGCQFVHTSVANSLGVLVTVPDTSSYLEFVDLISGAALQVQNAIAETPLANHRVSVDTLQA